MLFGHHNHHNHSLRRNLAEGHEKDAYFSLPFQHPLRKHFT